MSTEGDYVGQLPRHVAAPLGHGGVTPTVGGASADTRLADTVTDAPKADSGASSGSQSAEAAAPAYPTGSKERENERRRRLKEEGKEIPIKKKNIPVEDHFDDCGEDLSSLIGTALIDGDESDGTSAIESDAAHDEDLRCTLGVRAYPIDASKVAPAQPGELTRGRDPRAPKAKESACDGCRNFRPRNDWEHSRKIGKCSYPYDEPFISKCDACVARLPNYSSRHTFEAGKCRWGEPIARTAP